MLSNQEHVKEETSNNNLLFDLITQILMHANQDLANIRVFATIQTLVTIVLGKEAMTPSII